MFEDYATPLELFPTDPRFGVGPSLVSVQALQALAATGKHLLGRGHRSRLVRDLVGDIQQGLSGYFDLPANYEVVLGNGGATMLFDAIGLGLVDKKIAHFTCGEFSAKWAASSRAIGWIESEVCRKDFGEGITAVPIPGADTLAITLSETSTGAVCGPIPDTPNDVLVCVDATSGAGQTPCDLAKVDLFFFSPQKVFAGEGGLYVAFMSPAALERVGRIAARSDRYIPPFMSWQKALENSRKCQTYTTPALSGLFLLRWQIEQMNKVGRKAIEQQGRQKAQMIYDWAHQKSYLSPYVADQRYRSSVVAVVDVDERIDVAALLAKLEQERSVYNINSYRRLGRNQFRIALFPNIRIEDLEKLTRLLSRAIESVLAQ